MGCQHLAQITSQDMQKMTQMAANMDPSVMASRLQKGGERERESNPKP